jgi:hypothetical protein
LAVGKLAVGKLAVGCRRFAVGKWAAGAACELTALSLGERVSRCRRFHQPERDG